VPPLARIVALYCGQGMAHTLEIYDGGNESQPPDFLALLDFGGNKGPAQDAIDYVYAKLASQTARTPTLDLIVLSHQDGDHVNLLAGLGEKISANSLTFNIDQIYAGGLGWGSGSKKVVNDFIALAAHSAAVAFERAFRSDYYHKSARNQLNWLCSHGSVIIRVLCAQLPLTDVRNDIYRNGTSAVLVVENGSVAVVLPGDATYQTLEWINGIWEWWASQTPPVDPLVPQIHFLEVPHHGALRTSVEDYEASESFDAFNVSIIETFIDYLEAWGIFASAGVRNTHGHPVKEVLDLFDKHLYEPSKAKKYVAYVFGNKSVQRRQRFANFAEKLLKQTLITQLNTDGTWNWQNINITLGGTTVEDMLDASRSLRQMMVDEGLERFIEGGPPEPAPVRAPVQVKIDPTRRRG